MLQFYKELNGFVFSWRFVDEDNWHGCLFIGLSDDGRNVVDPRSHYPGMPYQSVKQCGEYFFDESAGFKPDSKVLFFEGATDAAGTLLCEDRFWNWDNDGFVRSLGTSFTDYIERGLRTGFCHMWESEGHHIPVKVAERLAKQVDYRKTFEVTVESVEELTSGQYRQNMGRLMQERHFDQIMVALNRPERAEDLNPKQRGIALDEATKDIKAINAKQAKAILTILYTPKRTKKAFVAHFRCDSTSGLIKTRIRLKYLGGKDQIPLQEEISTTIRVLNDVGCLLPGEVSPYLIAYTYLPKMGIWSRPDKSHERIQNWSGGPDSKEAIFDFIFEKEIVDSLTPGTYFSTALPSVMSNINRQ